ncbi:hypothetical protein [Flavobacterium sp.]|uniref:hypothetical protein n=1 Tax=Flavobacterium sp. TaxID=239 RepID=UPI0026238A91|nr:hypothetical protein [Flavobacterium sp.]
MNKAVEGDFLYKEFKHINLDKWAFISLSFDRQDTTNVYRVNYFDKQGFVSHTHMNLTKGVQELVEGQFTVPDIGRLDMLQQTACWRLGIERDQIRSVFDRGDITWNQMIDAFEKINSEVLSEG